MSDDTASGSKSNTNVGLTVIRSINDLAKTFSWKNGKLEKSVAGALSLGIAERVHVEGLGGLRELINGVRQPGNHSTVLTLGQFVGEGDRRLVVRNEDLQKGADAIAKRRRVALRKGLILPEEVDTIGVVARSLKHFSFRKSEPGFVLLDYDFKPEELTEDSREKAEEFHGLVEQVGLVPALYDVTALKQLSDVGYLEIPSSSNGIVLPDGTVKGSSGRHAYLVAESAADVRDIPHAIFNHAVAKDFAWLMLARNGRVMKRGVVDVTVASPERLVFECLPRVGPALDKLPAEFVYREGPALGHIRGVRKNVASTWEELIGNRGHVEYVDGQPLPLNWVLVRSSGEAVTVSELYAAGKDAKEFFDPIEGPAYGHATAKYFHNDGLRSCVYSHAHGGVRYEVEIPADMRVKLAATRPSADAIRVEEILRNAGWSIAYDEFQRNIEFTHLATGVRRYITDSFVIEVQGWMQAADPRQGAPGKERVGDILLNLAREHRPYNPAQDYLRGLKWDGTPRLETWILPAWGLGGKATAGGSEGEDEDEEEKDAKGKKERYLRWASKAIAVALVKRIMDPGCKLDWVPTLLGEQDKQKSLSISKLVPNSEWFTDSLPIGASPKEVIEATDGIWVVELSELRGMGRHSDEEIKAFITRTKDKARRAYGRFSETVLRQFMLFITANPTSKGLFADPTGNRRYLILEVGQCDAAYVEGNRDQILAEAMMHLDFPLYFGGDNVEEAKEAKRLQEEYRKKGPYFDRLSEMVPANLPSFVRRSDIVDQLGLKTENVNEYKLTQVDAAMLALGFSQAKKVKQKDKGPGGRATTWMCYVCNPHSVALTSLPQLVWTPGEESFSIKNPNEQPNPPEGPPASQGITLFRRPTIN